MPQFCILFFANYTILATQKGGAMAQCSPPKHAPGTIGVAKGGPQGARAPPQSKLHKRQKVMTT